MTKIQNKNTSHTHPREGGGPELEYFRTGPPIRSGVGYMRVVSFGILNLEFVSNFDIRISNL